MGLPGHGDVVEGEVIEERFARDRSKLRGKVDQLSLNKFCEIQKSARKWNVIVRLRKLERTLPLTRLGSS